MLIFFSIIIKFVQRFIFGSILTRGIDLAEQFGTQGLDKLGRVKKEADQWNTDDKVASQVGSYFSEFIKKRESIKFIVLLVVKPFLYFYELIFDPIGFFFLLFPMWNYYSFSAFMVTSTLYLGFKNFFGIFPENLKIGNTPFPFLFSLPIHTLSLSLSLLSLTGKAQSQAHGQLENLKAETR